MRGLAGPGGTKTPDFEDILRVAADRASEQGKAGVAEFINRFARDPEGALNLNIIDAIEIVRADYMEHIDGLANMIISEAASDFIVTDEEFQRFFDESLQADAWSIHSGLAKRVLLVSPNCGAYMDDAGQVDLNGPAAINEMAGMAMVADVRAAMVDEAGGFDLDSIREHLDDQYEEEEE